MTKYRAGLIGCGSIGSVYDERKKNKVFYTHAGMYKNSGAFELVAASDTDSVRLSRFGRFWGVPRLYSDYRDLLKRERLDIISIATPDQTHSGIIRDVVKYGSAKFIFTEKPLAENAASASAILEACRKNRVTLVVDYIRRWDDNHQSIRRYIAEGKLGRINFATGYYVRGLHHNGCQMVNTVRYFLGNVKEVQAIEPLQRHSRKTDPSLSVRLQTEGGVPVVLCGLDRRGYDFSIFELDIFGTLGRIRITDGGSRIFLNAIKPDKRFPNFKALTACSSPWRRPTYGKAMSRAGKEFAAFLSGRLSAVQNMASDSIQDLEIIDASLRSAASNNKIVIVRTKVNLSNKELGNG